MLTGFVAQQILTLVDESVSVEHRLQTASLLSRWLVTPTTTTPLPALPFVSDTAAHLRGVVELVNETRIEVPLERLVLGFLHQRPKRATPPTLLRQMASLLGRLYARTSYRSQQSSGSVRSAAMHGCESSEDTPLEDCLVTLA